MEIYRFVYAVENTRVRGGGYFTLSLYQSYNSSAEFWYHIID